MAAPKKWNTHASMPRKRLNSTDIIIFSIIAVIILIAAVLIGAAMDESTVNGKVNTAKLGQGFSAAMQHPGTLLKRLAEKGSNVQKMLLVAVMGLGIFALYKFSIEPKRLHRHGKEYGSARWGTPADSSAKLLTRLHPAAWSPSSHPAARWIRRTRTFVNTLRCEPI